METDKFLIVDYSDKAIAIPGDFDTCLQPEYKLIGGRFNSRLKFGPGWIFSKSKCEERIKHLFTVYQVEFTNVALSDIVSDTTSTGASTSELPEYIKIDKNDLIVTLSDGGTFTINGCKLKTEFWFGYSDMGQGPTSEECSAAVNNARTNEQYFIDENLSDIDNRMELLTDPTKTGRIEKYLWLLGDQSGAWSLDTNDTDDPDNLKTWERNKYNQGLYKPLGRADQQRLIAAYSQLRVMREKRCRAYLKRYGLSKIKVSTYWMDR